MHRQPTPNRQPTSTRLCAVCGTALSVHRRVVGDTCENRTCQQVRLRQTLQAQSERHRAWREQAEDRARQPGSDDPQSTQPELPVAFVPVNELPIVNLPEKRKRRFRDHLLRVVSQAVAQHLTAAPREGTEPGSRLEERALDPQQLQVLGGVCGTCRGHCCPDGGERAFLHPETIRRFIDQHPEMRPRQIVAAYLERLPNRSYRQSCVYHGRFGCHLPREMRSRICNVFLCRGLHAFADELRESGGLRGAAFAIKEPRAVRAAMLSQDGLEEFEARGVPETRPVVGKTEPGRVY
jgi:hypothetical protein